jgi:glucokinase
MNDFVANGYGLLTLNHSDANDVLVLQDVPPIFGAPLACIGAGTGLGECFVTSPNRHGVPDYTAYPSEGVKLSRTVILLIPIYLFL